MSCQRRGLRNGTSVALLLDALSVLNIGGGRVAIPGQADALRRISSNTNTMLKNMHKTPLLAIEHQAPNSL